MGSDHAYMPYPPRACQDEIINDVARALDEGRHLVLESGTGTGKTVASLAGALEHAIPRGKQIVYAARTVSQCDQAMRELRAISRVADVSGIVVTGRGKSCPRMRDINGIESIPPHVQYALCQEMRRKGGCRLSPYADIAMLDRLCRNEFPSSAEFDRACEGQGACPYDARRSMIGRTDVVAVPYAYLLAEDVRGRLLSGMTEGDPSGITIIIDEAHNFAEHAREFESFTISSGLVRSAVDACEGEGPELAPGVSLKSFMESFWDEVRRIAAAEIGLGQKEHMLGPDGPEERLREKLGISARGLEDAIAKMMEEGESQTASNVENGKPEASPIEMLGERMERWCLSPSERFVKSVNVDRDGEYLRAACVDVTEMSRFLASVPGAVHMSGTLRPLDQYARILGLPDSTRCRSYPSPFPPENRKVVYSTKVTTKYSVLKKDPGMASAICGLISGLCATTDENTIVFFTSYASLRTFRPMLEGLIGRRSYWEDGNARSTAESLEEFKARKGGVFFSVIGGSVSEGIDFPGDELSFVIIVGIPYTPPSCELTAISERLDKRYGKGKGWIYASEVPAIRRVNQAIGRMIRTETDSGLAVILDSRASRYEKEFDAVPSEDPIAYARRFFSRRRRSVRNRPDNVITDSAMDVHAEPFLSKVQKPAAARRNEMPGMRNPRRRRLGQQPDLPFRDHGQRRQEAGAEDHPCRGGAVHAL